MSDLLVTFASSLTRGWVRLYTRGVSPPARTRRRAEVDSDLWEQADEGRESGRRAFETALAILARLLFGMPADLSWRLEHRGSGRSATRMIEGSRTMLVAMKQNKMVVLASLLGALYIAGGIGSAIVGEDVSLSWSFLLLASGGLVVGGLVAWTRGRRTGGILLACGVSLGAAMTFWLLFIPPLVAILIVIWVITKWSGRTPAPA